MPRRRLPPYVQVIRRAGRPDRYRGWAMVAGKRRFAKTRTDADQAHRDAVAMRKTAADAPAWGGSFGQRTDEWLAAIAYTVTPDTVAFYRGKLKTVHKTIGRTLPLERLTASVLRVLVADLKAAGTGNRTAQHVRRTLSAFYGWLKRRGIVDDSPVDAVEWPRPAETKPDVLNEVELAGCLARVADPWAKALAVAMAYTGLRRAEVARLQVADVDLPQRRLWVRGKARAQAHPVPEDAVAAVQTLLDAAAGEFVVPGSTDRARRNRIAETFRKWQRKMREPRWHAHALRHSVATILIRRGVSPAVVQRFLRHASFAMTQRYVSLVEADLREAGSRLRLLGDDEAAEHG